MPWNFKLAQLLFFLQCSLYFHLVAVLGIFFKYKLFVIEQTLSDRFYTRPESCRAVPRCAKSLSTFDAKSDSCKSFELSATVQFFINVRGISLLMGIVSHRAASSGSMGSRVCERSGAPTISSPRSEHLIITPLQLRSGFPISRSTPHSLISETPLRV